MDRFSWLLRFALCATLLVSPALAQTAQTTQTAQPGTPAPSKTVMTGETLNVQLFNVTWGLERRSGKAIAPLF